MAGYPCAEVGAVRGADAASWATWRDGDSVDLARQAADLFADAARGHGSPVARALVALDRLDEMLASLPDDLRGAVLLWSISVTNPEWEVAAVVEHGRVTHELTVADGRAVSYPDELYFQQHVVSAPISPAAADGDAPAPVESGISGEALFARGTAFASAGDRHAAQQAWSEAAEEHNHALSMRALGDLSADREDLKTAEEWYGRAAMLNDTPSMNRIATLLEGRGQTERAAEWLRRAARFGDEEAARRLQGDVVAASV
jgi:TPR repeat protein